jgi:methyl-accepting chemotaxis protein
MTRPLARLVGGVRAVAAGNLDLTLPAKQHDELGELSGAFNDMVRQLRARRDLQRLVDQSQAAERHGLIHGEIRRLTSLTGSANRSLWSRLRIGGCYLMSRADFLATATTGGSSPT